MAIKKQIKTPLVNTYHTLDKLVEDYYNEMGEFTDERLEKFKQYFLDMDEYERFILVLYAEYNSYRMVAEETYCSYGTIKTILSKIGKDINNL
jgi:uncharacterized membrane-anchored protein YjiN (DUF445 family)